jgi:hypothetical protein
MGAPKIKLYELPVGYVASEDADIQQTLFDELLPVVDKPQSPDDAYQMTGVSGLITETLKAVDVAFGYVDSLLEGTWPWLTPETAATDMFVNGVSPFNPSVYDGGGSMVASSGYQATPSGVMFTAAAPSGCGVRYWKEGAASSLYWAASCSGFYDGGNRSFQPVVLDGSLELFPSGYSTVGASGLVALSSAPSGEVSMEFWKLSPWSKTFIAEHDLWVLPNTKGRAGGHMYMGPDVFRGMHDYAGDDTIDESTGVPIVQGEIPHYVEEAEYQLDCRMGMVLFASGVDSASTPVRASYAHLAGVSNVTGQTLEPVASGEWGVAYAASPDPRHPLSHGARWVGRDDETTVRNIYAGGELTPVARTITPYDNLTLKGV